MGRDLSNRQVFAQKNSNFLLPLLKPKRSMSFLVIFCIIILAGVLIYLGCWLWQKQKLNRVVNVNGYLQIKIAPKYQKLDDLKIAENLVKEFHSTPLFKNAKQEVKEVLLEEFFGFRISSFGYRLYSFLVPCLEEFNYNEEYLALATDKSNAFFIENRESFNSFTSSLNLLLEDEKEIVNFTQAYLRMIPDLSSGILWELPSLAEDKSTDHNISFREWFKENEEYEFHPPRVKSIGEGNFADYAVDYYTWYLPGGILTYNYFELTGAGKIVEYTEKKLADRVGRYIII